MLTPKPASCAACPLHCDGLGFSQPEGAGTNGVLIVGEASGRSERNDGLPFRPYADAGSVLHDVIRLAGQDRQQFTITNVVRCQPGKMAGTFVGTNELEGASYEMEAIAQCRQHLDAVVRAARPRCILALGNIPLRTLTGMTGHKQTVTFVRGFVLRSPQYDVPVVATYHPSFLRRGAMHLKGVVRRDLELALRIAQKGITVPPTDYTLYPTAEQARAFVREVEAHPEWDLSYDIETREVAGEEEDDLEWSSTEITQCQFSVRPGHAIVFPWCGEYEAACRRVLASPNRKLGWNCFHKHTSVKMSDGKWSPIYDIKVGDYVQTLHDGKIVAKRVAATPRIVDDRLWLEVRVSGAYNRGVGRWGNRGVICTYDHEWILASGDRRQAQHLTPGTPILLPYPGAFDLIHGTGLGDGHVKAGRLRLSHSNQGWAQAKAVNLGVTLREYMPHGGFSADKPQYALEACVPEVWRDYLYHGRQKVWSEPSDRALAILYGDDGCLHGCGNLARRPAASIALHKFTSDDCAKVLAWARNKFGGCQLYKSKNGVVLALWVEASAKFFATIAPYLHPSMAYKLPSAYQGQYNGWMEQIVPQVGWVTKVLQYESSRKTSRTKYCLTVEDSHAFFTRGGLVANCWGFDNPVLQRHDAKVNGEVVDGMWCFHHLQPDLPRNLQFATSFYAPELGPWKHLAGSDLAFYGALDVDSVQRISSKVFDDLRRAGVYRGWERHVQRLHPILARMSERGLPIDREAQAKFREELGVTIADSFAKMQDLVPDHLKNCLPKTGYVNDKLALKAQERNHLEPGEKWARRTFVVTPRAKKGEVGEAGPVERWVRLQPFKPSNQQLVQYIRYRGHKVPHAPGEDAETTGKLGLQRLLAKTRDPLYEEVLRYRESEKLQGTYVDGWRCGADGRVHATFLFAPATGQLASRAPNVQTTPKRGNLAKTFRKIIAARPGHTLLEFDYKSFHALTLGFEAGDSDYMRAARTDIHSIVCATQMLKVEKLDTLWALSDAELMERLAWWKSNKERTWPSADGPKTFKWLRDFKAKSAGLGYGFGLGANKMYEMYMESFESKADAQRVIDGINAAFPRTAKFRDDIRRLAQQRKHLLSKHGYIRWFWDVMTWDARAGRWRMGADSEKVIAFLPANDAFGVIKEAMLRIEGRGWSERYGLINQIHDALLFECPDPRVEECIANVQTEMEKPSEVLVSEVAPGGLTCAVSVSVGPNLGEMREL